MRRHADAPCGDRIERHVKARTLLVFAIAMAALLALVSGAQAKFVVNGFGTTGTFGGQFGAEPRSVAVNNSGVGVPAAGTSYVADTVNNRVERFSPNGVFERAFGQNVLGRDEQQLLKFENAESGTFTLTFGASTTSPITFKGGSFGEPGASALSTALNALPSIGSGNVSVLGNVESGFTIRFRGILSGTDVAQVTANGTGLVGELPPMVSVTTIENGSGGNFTGPEICTSVATCQDGISNASGASTPTTSNGGQLNRPIGIAVNQATGNVYITEANNRRVSEFDAEGNFIRAWGWDVISSGKPNDNGTGFEICDTTNGNLATDCKQAAAAGKGVGQFAANPGQPTIDASGNVWVPDPGNARIQEFDSTGHFLKIVGGDVINNGAEGTGTLTSGSKTVSSLVTTKKYFEVGQKITAPAGIAAGTTITAVTATSLTLSNAATATGSQTLTVAPGTGNVASNETQMITVSGNPTDGKFSLSFEGQTTGATGEGKALNGTTEITNVITKTGQFKVGMQLTVFTLASSQYLPAGTLITAVGANTLTVNQPITGLPPSGFLKLSAFDIDHNAPASQLAEHLNGLSSVGGVGGSVNVTGPNGGPWTVEYGGTRYAGADVPTMTATSTGLFKEETGKISIGFTSANHFEACTVAADCRGGATGNAPGQFSGTSPGDLAFDSSGNLYAIDPGSNRVEKFNSALTSAADFGASALAPYTTSAPERLVATQGGSRLLFAVNNNVSASERQLVEFDTNAVVKDTSLIGSGLSSVSGLGENEATGTDYLVTSSEVSPRRVLMLTSAPPAVPVVTLSPITTKSSTTATLSGTIDPTGGLVACEFEYSTDQATWTRVKESECESLSPNGGAQAVSQGIAELVPNTHYFVRLSVSRPLLLNSTKRSSVQGFDTDSVPPAVANVGVVNVTNNSARLTGQINPHHSSTEYHFEYGTTLALSSATESVAIGSGATPLIASQAIADLAANTEYLYKLVASNPAGPTSSAVLSFTTRAQPLPLPADRAYEMVSPPDKNFGGVLSGKWRKGTVAPNGEAVAICPSSLFGEPSGVQSWTCAPYVSFRTASGWETKASHPYICRNGTQGSAVTPVSVTYSHNLDNATLGEWEPQGCLLPPFAPGGTPGFENNYLRDEHTGVSQFLLSGFGGTAGISQDSAHVVLVSEANALPEATGTNRKLYDWSNGTLNLVSRKPNNEPLTVNAEVASGLSGASRPGSNAVSSDGSRIFFAAPSFPGTNPEPGQEIYMRENDSVTYDISESECTSACGPQAASVMEEATPDGTKAFIKSQRKLTDAAAVGTNLYVYTHGPSPASEPHNLILMSEDNEPNDGKNPKVVAVLGSSEDGQVAYFVAEGQILAGEPTSGKFKIYRWQWNNGVPAITYLGAINAGEGTNWENSESFTGFQPNRLVTGDGKYLLINTKVALDPAADTDMTGDIYRWSEEDGWVCISCQAPGQPSAGDAIFYMQMHASKFSSFEAQNGIRRIVMSNDGQRIFFATPDSLVPQDVNGSVIDAYEWHDGAIHLISTGTEEQDVVLLGSSESGDDVFFVTDQKLVGWDVDLVGDVYDARIGGGFPEPAATGTPCEGEACRGAGTSAPPASTAGTAVFEAPGNKSKLVTKPCRRGFVKRHGKCFERHHRSPRRHPNRKDR